MQELADLCHSRDLSGRFRVYTRRIRSATLYKILSNPIYIGKLRHRQNIYDGEHPPIIDADRFAQAQALLAEQAATPRGSAAHRDSHTLSGFAVR
jgi:site-specific DNA recombinase